MRPASRWIYHTIQQWKLELLRFDFTIVHRPTWMLTECNMLSQYNTWTSQWRLDKNDADNLTPSSPLSLLSIYTDVEHNTRITMYKRWTEEQERLERHTDWTLPKFAQQLSTTTPIPHTHMNPQTQGPDVTNKASMAAAYDATCTTWIIGAGAKTATTAMLTLGLTPLPVHRTEEKTHWQHSIGNNTFIIKATDGITSRAARPIRKHELLMALGFNKTQTKAMSTMTTGQQYQNK